MFRVLGVFALIPTALLLTVSFFVLVVLRKIELQGLKAFGYVVAAALWIAALLTFSMGIYVISTGDHPILGMMRQMQSGHMGQMMPGYGKGPWQENKNCPAKDRTPQAIPGQMGGPTRQQ
jgi:hypothetical protein